MFESACLESNVDCPICMEKIINYRSDCCTTECGHTFHSSCIFKNLTNSFACPMCRNQLVEEPVNDDDDDDDSDYIRYEELYDDNALTSFRMFHQHLNNEEIEDEEQDEEQEQEAEELVPQFPSAVFIARKLAQQGVTMEQLVKCLMLNHEEYEDEDQKLMREESIMFGKFRRIILNYEVGEEENLICSCGSMCRICTN